MTRTNRSQAVEPKAPMRGQWDGIRGMATVGRHPWDGNRGAGPVHLEAARSPRLVRAGAAKWTL